MEGYLVRLENNSKDQKNIHPCPILVKKISPHRSDQTADALTRTALSGWAMPL